MRGVNGRLRQDRKYIFLPEDSKEGGKITPCTECGAMYAKERWYDVSCSACRKARVARMQERVVHYWIIGLTWASVIILCVYLATILNRLSS